MFNENELVIYGSTGVCRITAIGTPDFARESGAKYYYLEPLYQSGIIYAPCDGENISLRSIISANKAKKLINSIPSVEAEVFSGQSLQQLSQHYQGIIDEHSCDALVSLVKSIYLKEKEAEAKNKKLGQIDRRYLKLAEDLLYGELAAALGKDRDQLADKMVSEMKI